MENLKIQIKIEDNDDLKEAHDLLLKLGFSTYSEESFGVWANCPKPIWLKTKCFDDKPNKIDWVDSGNYKPFKEITLPELRDLVVLNRNDVGDANYKLFISPSQGYLSLYKDSKDIFYAYAAKSKTWDESKSVGVNTKNLEPIEKPVKEFLRKNNDGEYILEVTNEREAQEPHAKHWIEVPKGCDYLISVFGVNSFIDSDMFAKIKTKNVLWSRKPMKEYLNKETHEFVRSSSELNDMWIEIPEGCNIITCENRKGNLIYFHWKSLDSDEFFLKDEKIWSNNFNETLSDFIEKNEGDVVIIWSRHTHPEELPFIDDEPLQSLNDQYAEIEKVRQDSINSPSHYADSTIECIDAMEAMMTPEQFIGYLRGNVFKYQWRYEKKNGIEDLKKAQWYLERLTEKVAEKNAPF